MHHPLLKNYYVTKQVDTLFKIKCYFLDLWLFSRCRNSIKTGVVERLIVFQHTVYSMEQFTHDCTDAL